jgi:hypothetical protein
MRAPTALLASLLLAACATPNGSGGRGENGQIYLLPPAPAMERARTTELASLPDGGPEAAPAARER